MKRVYTGLVTCLTVVCAMAAAAAAAPPYTLEELMSPPYPFGASAGQPVLSDDGAWLGCLWDDTGYGTRDVWVCELASREWTRLTESWPEKEARLRREFNRDLEQARRDWEEEHQPPEDEAGTDGSATEADGAATTEAGETVAEDEAGEFDEAERVEEFEEDLEKQHKRHGGIGQLAFRRDSHELYWVYEGRLYSRDLDSADGTRLRLNHEDGYRVIDVLPDCDAFLMASDSDLYLWWPATGKLEALTKGGYGDQANDGAIALSPDRRWLAVVVRDYSRVRNTQIPELLADDPHTTSQHYVRPEDTPETVRLKLFDLSAEPPWPTEVELDDEPYYQVVNLDWSPVPGDTRLLVGNITGDTQDYRAYLVTPPDNDIDDPGVELIYTEHDDRWVNWARTAVAWCDDAGLVLLSEQNGYAGLYELVRKPEEETAADEAEEEATDAEEVDDSEDAANGDEESAEDTGSYEAHPLYLCEPELISIEPFRHSHRILLHQRYPDHTGARVAIFDLSDRSCHPLLQGEAWYSPAGMNEAENLLSYQVKDERRFTELGITSVPAPGEDGCVLNGEIILKRDTPEFNAWADTWDVRFLEIPLAEFPEYENIYRGEEHLTVGSLPIKLWLPPGWTADGTYPLLVWIHGAGYASTVTRDPGWTTLPHPWLAEELGWIVAEVEFRGSKGLGRDWRTDVWGRLGHPETDDLIATRRYLIDNYGADPRRTAIWGWSYGGFQTLMTMGLAPGEFPVGVAVAPVNRWENYNYWYSTCRLGDPKENEDEYDRSAPETWLEHVEGDVLIMHGLRDGNTLFQSIAQYLEEGHKLGINVELKLFPSDGHGMGNEQHYIRVFEGLVDYITEHWPAE